MPNQEPAESQASDAPEEIRRIAAETGFGTDAVLAFAEALAVGGGTMAQFRHPELGGSGQWSAGGMLMISDMFNDALKGRVRGLAEVVARAAADGRLVLADPSAARGGRSGGDWWPEGLGRPASTGAQNGRRYAVFPAARRLAVEWDGRLTLYDTAGLSIGGASQSQGFTPGLSFSTESGTIGLDDLAEVGAEPASDRNSSDGERLPRPIEVQTPSDGMNAAPEAEAVPPVMSGTPTPRAGMGDVGTADPIATIRRLFELHVEGVLTEEEFTAKKGELLGRL
ncbi:MAG: SHOCT domain-containing protein [Rhizobiaceae bacterium]|nr:SHOCT domain-containing protein [Rhizobiaceae bacterium]